MAKKQNYHKRHPGAPCDWDHYAKEYCGRAALTVEASIVIPIFLFISVCIMLFFNVLAVEWSVSTSLNETARETALYGRGTDDSGVQLSPGAVSAIAYARIISKGPPAGCVVGRAFGFDLSESTVSDKDIILVANYTISFPVKLFGRTGMRVTQQARAHRWVGFDPSEGKGGDLETVYITKFGKAFHCSLNCSYLNPSIVPVSIDSVEDRRNSGGHKYYPCPLCRGKASVVYITTYGENYHSLITCSGLKRTIRSTTRSDAQNNGFHACGKCGK